MDPGSTNSDSNKRGHRTSSLSETFIQKIPLTPIVHTQTYRCRVFFLFLTKSGSPYYYNVLVWMSISNQPISYQQIIVLEDQSTWITQQSRTLLLDEMAQALSMIIVNTHNKKKSTPKMRGCKMGLQMEERRREDKPLFMRGFHFNHTP